MYRTDQLPADGDVWLMLKTGRAVFVDIVGPAEIHWHSASGQEYSTRHADFMRRARRASPAEIVALMSAPGMASASVPSNGAGS